MIIEVDKLSGLDFNKGGYKMVKISLLTKMKELSWRWWLVIIMGVILYAWVAIFLFLCIKLH